MEQQAYFHHIVSNRSLTETTHFKGLVELVEPIQLILD
jgi:hypothetical protein